MPKKTKIDQSDIDAFQEAVKGTKPLTQKKIRLTPPHKKTILTNPSSSNEKTHFYFRESDTVDTVGSEAFIVYKQEGISNKTLRKLRKGQYNVEALLDLHGMTVEEAKAAIDHFLHECLSAQLRVVLIIHGKGQHKQVPVLKNKINHWLRDLEVVLAFCSAAPMHGSRGAIYVLLKRNTI